jgi:putative oxidoreductase
MKIASLVARWLLGIMFLVFGLNGFLNFIPQPPFPVLAMQFFGTLYASHYVFVIFGLQVILGAMLLADFYTPLAVILLAPIIVNIFFFHALMAPSGLPPALFVVVLWLIVAIYNRPAYDGILQRKPSQLPSV